MSGADIPYQLRPNKYIDRQMFIELLSRLVISRSAEKYIYVSMGGRHLVDHCAIYNRLGIDAQYSFDIDHNVVKRQLFNRPTGKTVCARLNSAELPSRIDEIFRKFPSKKNLIVWLDYTNTYRRAQLQEAVQTLVRLKHGDVFRITLNAHLNSLGDGDSWREKGAASPAEYRATKLREQINEFMPTSITTIGETEFPVVLARCVELAVNAAESLQPNLEIRPSLITSYSDGQRMLTVTCSISEADSQDSFPPPSFRRWRYRCRDWNDIRSISAPVLSTREQERLDVRLHYGVSKMLAGLKFLPGSNRQASLEALRSYREFHRFYPSFRAVED